MDNLIKVKIFSLSNGIEILDNINLFWIRNIDVVRLYLETVSLHSESFVYIASSFIEYNHNEHLPFLLVGSQRILNDELSRYAYLCCNMPKENEIKYLLKQIVKLAENNLKILEDTSENILIFPLDLLVKLREDNILFKVSESLFVNMFNDIKDLNDYFKKCNSFDDIINYARENFSKGIVFSENDDKSLPIRERFKCVVSEFDFILDSHHTDAYNFYAIVYGNIQQAIQIVA